MIVGEQKPFDEIWGMVKNHKQITVFGCNTCVSVCHQGGNKEAEILGVATADAGNPGRKLILKLAVSNVNVNIRFLKN